MRDEDLEHKMVSDCEQESADQASELPQEQQLPGVHDELNQDPSTSPRGLQFRLSLEDTELELPSGLPAVVRDKVSDETENHQVSITLPAGAAPGKRFLVTIGLPPHMPRGTQLVAQQLQLHHNEARRALARASAAAVAPRARPPSPEAPASAVCGMSAAGVALAAEVAAEVAVAMAAVL